MKRIFISDLHLDPARTDLTEAFLSFLGKECHNIDELYILGDFFEVWLGDDDVTPLSRTVTTALAELQCDVFIMHGNRDFLIGERFCRSANATLLTDPTLLDLDGLPVLLMHGDSLCTRDIAYMDARTKLRHPAFQADFLAKSLADRAAFAASIRGESNQLKRETAADIMDVTPQEVIHVMEQAGVDVLIHGHTHRPAHHEVAMSRGTGHRYVLGDWDPAMVYLLSQGASLSLIPYEFG